MREYFCAYHSMLGAMRKLSDAECGRLFRALLAYSSGEQLDNLQGREELLFDVFAQQIDRDAEKYKAKCDTNRTNRQRSMTMDNGRQRSSTIVNGRHQDKEKDKEESSTPRSELMDDDEAESLIAGHQQVFDAAHRAGFPADTATLDRITGLIADHGAEAVLGALDVCVEQGVKKISYLRSVLANGSKPRPSPREEPRLQRLF